MTLSPAFLDELRARTLLSALIGRTTKLQRAGREWKACCPFHNEKTPSFTVNDDKGFYHCFGCSAHGDAIRWMTDQRGLPFMDAVKELADAAGLEMPAPDPRAQERQERAKTLHDVMEAAARWFEEQLGGIEGSPARDYLTGRGIEEEARRRFRLGFAPDSRGRLKAALSDFGTELMVEAGLLVAPDDGRKPYDRFRGRLMIPIRDQRGRVIAFGGRILGPGEPKYLNSPETPLFDKGRTLYNLDRASPASRSAGRVIVVEGYMDVIALDRAGIGEAVAPLGTALTEGQLERLWRLAPTPILCFDGDAAGQKAAYRAALRALPLIGPDRSLAFVTLPPGQDPDDLVRAGGKGRLEALLAGTEPLVDRIWNAERDAEPLATPEQRASLKQRLLEHSETIADRDVRDGYRADLLARYQQLVRPRWEPRRPQQGRSQQRGGWKSAPAPTSAAAKAVGGGGLPAEMLRAILAGLVRYPDLIADHAEMLADLPIASPHDVSLRDMLLHAAMANSALDSEGLGTILAAAGVELPRLSGGLAFSFNRRDGEPERARRDLVLAIETLAARPGIEAALGAATARLQDAGDEAAFLEQQRLRAAREEANRQLATLYEGDAGGSFED
jgi:DNA primase